MKLVLLDEMNVVSNEVVASHYSKVISLLKEAIETKSQVILLKYQSVRVARVHKETEMSPFLLSISELGVLHL